MRILLIASLCLIIGCRSNTRGVEVFLTFYTEKDMKLAKNKIKNLELPGFYELETKSLTYGFRLNHEITGEPLGLMFDDPEQVVFAEAIDVNLILAVLPAKYMGSISPIDYAYGKESQIALIKDPKMVEEIKTYLDSINEVDGGLPFIPCFIKEANPVDDRTYLHLLSVDDQILLGDQIEHISITKEDWGNLVMITFSDESASKIEEITAQNIDEYIGIVINGKVCSVPVVTDPIVGTTIQLSGEDIVENIFTGAFYDEEMGLKSIEINIED